MNRAERFERLDEIRRMQAEGVRQTEIAERLGLSREYLRRLCRDHGLAPRTKISRENFMVLGHGIEEATKTSRPTLALPGTYEKINELRRRAERGEQLWSEGDGLELLDGPDLD